MSKIKNECYATMDSKLNLEKQEPIPHLVRTSMAGASKEREEALNAIAGIQILPGPETNGTDNALLISILSTIGSSFRPS